MPLCRMLPIVLAVAALTGPALAAPQPELLVYATTSLSQSLGKISESYANDTGQHVTLSFAASPSLARQIEGGSKADVVLCADAEWMDYLEKRKLVDPATRRSLLRNRLVLISPADKDLKLQIGRSFNLHAALGNGKLALGEPESVPVGRFARYALISLGVWNSVGEQLLPQENARNVIAAVADGSAPLGVVFETDALPEKRVRIVDVFPMDSHPPISYLVASTPSAQAGAARFMEFLRSSDSRDIFQRYGFRPAQ